MQKNSYTKAPQRLVRCGVFLLFMAGIASCAGSKGNDDQGTMHDAQCTVYQFGLPTDAFRIDTGQVHDGETLGGIFCRLGASREQQNYLLCLNKDEFDYRTIRSGKRYYAFYAPDTLGVEHLCHWVYEQDVRTAVVLHMQDSFYVEQQTKDIDVRPCTAEAVIESNLWNAMINNDLPVSLALELSEIYAWTIDFFGLQQGDSIRVYYDEQWVDNNRIGIGRIHAAHFYHARTWQEAYYFDARCTMPDAQCVGYFDADGNSLRKAFLKAPLNYKRISSHFTYARKHPIYKVVRPHTGVDYAAPAGTPVVSIGDGVVIEKGYKGGGGNTVKIRHNSTYTTAYLHLSKFAKGLAVGKHVAQGEVIGYVGSTGSSTGPHLDFRVWKGGSPIDPLKMVSPPVEPIPAELRPTSDSVVVGLREHL
ncbi:MAG: M23 family metallopeptidase [Bacteroidales bacterium]|nr:M23 family metallopeptidase [Candidatus Colicola coprequi]